jgi:hypothetical protein
MMSGLSISAVPYCDSTPTCTAGEAQDVVRLVTFACAFCQHSGPRVIIPFWLINKPATYYVPEIILWQT